MKFIIHTTEPIPNEVFTKVVSDFAGVVQAYQILAESQSEIIAAPHRWAKGATISVEQA